MDAGQSKTFTAIASGGTESYTKYHWYSFGVSIPFQGGLSTLPWVTTPSDPGGNFYSLSVIVDDSLGDSSPQPQSFALLTVNSILGTPSAFASPGTVNQGQSSSLSVTGLSGGTTPYTYQWRQRAPGAVGYSDITGATSSSYVFSTSGSTVTGSWSFELHVTDSASSSMEVWSSAASVMVNPQLVPSVSVTPSSWTMDIGQSKTFAASASGGSGSYSSYQWYVDGVFQSGATSSTFDYAPTSTGSHSITVTVTDSSGTTSSQSSAATVTVNTKPSVNLTPETWIMDVGQSKLFTATASGGSGSYVNYQWYVGGVAVSGQTAQTFNYAPTSAGSPVITATVTDNIGVTSPIQTISPAVTVNSAFSTPSASASQSAVNQGQSSTLSITGLSGGTMPYTYQWLQKAPGAGSYSVISGATSNTYPFSTSTSTATGSWSFEVQVTDGASSQVSVTSSTTTVTVNTAGSGPSVTVSPSSWTMDVGQSKLFTASGSGGSGSFTSYQWYVGGTAVSGQTASTFTYSASSAGSFSITVTVTDSLSATSAQSSPSSVTVNSALNAPTISVSASLLDQGQTSTLSSSAITTGSPPFTYQWYSMAPGANSFSSISYALSSSYSFDMTSIKTTGSWSLLLMVTDSTGASVNSSAVSITLNHALSTPSSTPSLGALNQGQSSTLSIIDLSGGCTPYIYRWFQKSPDSIDYSVINDAISSTYTFSLPVPPLQAAGVLKFRLPTAHLRP